MTNSQQVHAQVAFAALSVIGVAALGFALAPAKSATWSIGIATMVGIWFVVAAIGRARSFEIQSASERGFLVTSVTVGAAILVVSLGRKLALSIGLDGGEIVDRVIGIGICLALVAIGNTTPKILAPLAAKRCAPSQVQSLQRFVGWAFVLAGLAGVVGWLVLPTDKAGSWAAIATGVALASTILRCAWAFTRPRTTRSSPSET